MYIKFWGVRGSIPTPLTTEQLHERLFHALSGAAGLNLADPAEVQAYIAGLPSNVRRVVGGNTTCVEINTGTETIIIDCGSGMRALGLSLMAREFGRGQGVAHIFLTHAHWDHLLGFPFFAPAYVPGNKLVFYAVNHNPQAYLDHQQTAPTYFPIPPNAMPAEKEFVTLHEGQAVQIGRTVVSNLSLYHPGRAYAYRFDDGESVFVFASDAEYKALNDESLKRYVTFFADADALVFDSQYSLRDVFLSKQDWGHSSAIIGVDISERARVKKLITFHHDPTHSDEQIYAIAGAAREYATLNQIYPDTEVIVGVEGLELFLGQPSGVEFVEHYAEPVSTLALAGQLTSPTVAEVRARLSEALANAPSGRVLLDLTLLASADAIGIKGVLDTARQHPNVSLAALAPGAQIRRLLEQSATGEVLPVFVNRHTALNALAGPAHLRLAAETIGGHYQISEMLFVDDLGVVYRGADLTTRQPVVVRVVAGTAADPLRAEFTTKFKAWQAMQHPALLPGNAAIEHEAWAGFICEPPAGFSLRDWCGTRPPWLALWRTTMQLCQALAAVHSQDITHGALCPEDVIIGGTQAYVACAPLFARPPGHSPDAYQAPEQIRGQPPTPRSDVYALGILLYELCLGAHPFAAESEELRLTLQLYSPPQSPRLRWPEIPADLEAVLLKMLAHDPAERFADGQGVLKAFTKLRVEAGPGG